MTILNKIRAAILVAEARRLSSAHQTGQAFERMIAAYSRLGTVQAVAGLQRLAGTRVQARARSGRESQIA